MFWLIEKLRDPLNAHDTDDLDLHNEAADHLEDLQSVKESFSTCKQSLQVAADEIERLREEKKVIATHGLKQISEIQRLREALNNILHVKYYGEEGGYLESDSMRDIARSALQQKDR